MGPIECQLKERAQAIHTRFQSLRAPVKPVISAHVLELMGIIKGLKEELSIARTSLDVANAELQELRPKIHAHPIHNIIELVSKRENISKLDLVSSRRARNICAARLIVYYLAAETTSFSLPQIARVIGDRDHTTVLKGRDKIKTLRLFDSVMAAKLCWYEGQLAKGPGLDKRGA